MKRRWILRVGQEGSAADAPGIGKLPDAAGAEKTRSISPQPFVNLL